jgi:hypothetical protein
MRTSSSLQLSAIRRAMDLAGLGWWAGAHHHSAD